MKKKVIILGMLVAVCTSMVGCQKSDNYKLMETSKKEVLQIYEEKELEKQENALVKLRDVYTSGYICEEMKVDEIKEPAGVCCLENELVVTDRKTDAVYKIDSTGKVLKKAGGTGSNSGEYLSPTAVTRYQDNVYVVDQGNNRIQVLDKELNYVSEIKLESKKKIDTEYVPEVIAVNSQGVYVTGMSLEKPVVDKYTDRQKEEIGNNFFGSLFSFDDEIYLINSMSRYYDKGEDTLGALSNGPEWLMKIKDNKLEKICELPYGLQISSFTLTEDKIIAISKSGMSVFCLNKDGEYEETLGRVTELGDEDYPQISGNEKEEYFIAMPNAGKLLWCHTDK